MASLTILPHLENWRHLHHYIYVGVSIIAFFSYIIFIERLSVLSECLLSLAFKLPDNVVGLKILCGYERSELFKYNGA